MNIYVASSWRNHLQPAVVSALRAWGHEVYDFRHPPGETCFSWEQVGCSSYLGGPVTAEQQRHLTDNPVAIAGFESDWGALTDCDAIVYVLPCGRSASWELGAAMAMGKMAYILWLGEHEPELMFRGAKVLGSPEELEREFGS